MAPPKVRTLNLWTKFHELQTRCANKGCYTKSRKVCRKNCALKQPSAMKHAPVATDGNFLYVFHVEHMCIWEFNTLSYVWKKLTLEIEESEWPELARENISLRPNARIDDPQQNLSFHARHFFARNHNGAIPCPNSSTFFSFFDIGESIAFTRFTKTSNDGYHMERISMNTYLEQANNGGQSVIEDENILYFSQMNAVYHPLRQHEPLIKLDVWKLKYNEEEKTWIWEWLTRNTDYLDLRKMEGILIHENDNREEMFIEPDEFAADVLRWQFFAGDRLIWFGTSFNGYLSFSLTTHEFSIVEVQPSFGLVDLPHPVDYFNRILVGNCLYVYGGLEYLRSSKIVALDTMWVLNIDTKRWSSIKGGMAHPVESSSVVSPEDCIYAFGGKFLLDKGNSRGRTHDTEVPTNIVQRMWFRPPSLQRICAEKLLQTHPRILVDYPEMRASDTIGFMKAMVSYLEAKTHRSMKTEGLRRSNRIRMTEQRKVEGTSGIVTRKRRAGAGNTQEGVDHQEKKQRSG